MLTVADVLQMPSVRGADPEVLAGAELLDRQVRWVHTTELADIGPLLRGGDLVLTTGIALADHDEALARFVGSLVDSDAAGLVVELGRRWSTLPATLVEQCEQRGLPLVALHREVRFAAVAQAVGERLVDHQLAELRAAERVHDTFTELSITEAGPAEILAAAQRLAGAAVVLESAQHRIVDYVAGPADPSVEGAFLDDWERRSRNVRTTARTDWDASNGWLVTRIGRPERDWGRLVIGAPAAPTPGLTAVAERAAAALAMHRLHDRTRDGQLRRVHHELLIGLLSDPANSETHRRAEIAGLPTRGQYVGLALRPASAALLDDLVAACLRAAEVARAPTLVSVFDDEVRALVALPARGDAVRQTDRWAEQVTSRVATVVTAGSPVGGLASADRTLLEASQVLAALPPATRCARRAPTGRRAPARPAHPARGRRPADGVRRPRARGAPGPARAAPHPARGGRARRPQVGRRVGPQHLAAGPLRPDRQDRAPPRRLSRRRRAADLAARRAARGRRTSPELTRHACWPGAVTGTRLQECTQRHDRLGRDLRGDALADRPQPPLVTVAHHRGHHHARRW